LAKYCDSLEKNKFVSSKRTKHHKDFLKKLMRKWPYFIQVVEGIHPNIKKQYNINKFVATCNAILNRKEIKAGRKLKK